MPMAMSTRERHSAARIDSNASRTGSSAITVQPTLGARTESATTGLPSSPVVATADPVGARADDRRICRHIGAATGSVHADAGNENPFGTARVDQRERNDRRYLLQQPQPIDPAPFVLALGPGKLHDPTELIANSIGEGLYPVCCGAGLDLKEFIEIEA